MAGAGYWAYENGHLDAVIDAVDERFGTSLGGPAGDPVNVPPVPSISPVSDSLLFEDNIAPLVVPSPQTGPTGVMSEGERLLRDNWAEVHPWARANVVWVAAMMKQESNYNTNAVSVDGARGLLQVMPATMGDIYNRLRYRKYPPEKLSLHLPHVGIYYGTAYMQHLHEDYSNGSNRDWITRAYNAGPGGKRSNGTWPAETVNYLAKIKANHEKFQQQKGAA